MKATINSSKFYSSKFQECSIRQILSDFSTVKVLHYTVYTYIYSVYIHIHIYIYSVYNIYVNIHTYIYIFNSCNIGMSA